MKAERLFQILGLVDESLIEEAVSASPPAAVQRRPSWVRLLAAAACLAVICAGAWGLWQSNPGAGTGSPGDAALAGGDSGGDGHSPGHYLPVLRRAGLSADHGGNRTPA